MPSSQTLLSLLQLVSPALPVGAYTYSEGLETLVQTDQMSDVASLQHWLIQELRYGAIRVELGVFVRAYEQANRGDIQGLQRWNHWLSAFRETEELREQSWQMGQSLSRLLRSLQPHSQQLLTDCEPCNFAIAFAVAAASWQIDLPDAMLGYLHSWAANLINAGVRLIPLGQTSGQVLLMELATPLEQTVAQVLEQTDDQLECCSWGVSLASMNHEVLYSRLFRS